MPYIGNNHIAGDHTNNFKVLDDISSFTATFDGSATSVIDTTNNTIRVVEHRFIQGQRVTYTNGGGGNIGGLTTGTAYFVIFDSASTIKLATSASNAANSTAINLSAVGSGTSHTLNVAFDGVNTKFKITYNGGTGARFNNATQLNIAINNVLQKPNVNSSTFTEGFAIEDNHKIVFKIAPTSQDIFWGSIIANTLTTFDISDHKIDTFTGDGSTTEFTLSHTPSNNESLMVTINGVLQHPSNASTARAYTLIASIIQFTAAPGVGDEIQVRHIGFAGATTADVSGFYGRTGNVALTANDHITTGDITARNINASGILTASSANFSGNVSIGGTLTYEDVSNIDSVGIITARDGIHVGAGVSVVGVGTFGALKVGSGVTIESSGQLTSNNNIRLSANSDNHSATARLQLGSDQNFEIYHNASRDNVINVDRGNLVFKNSGNNLPHGSQIINRSDGQFLVANQAQNKYRIKAYDGGAVELYYNNVERFETTSQGINVIGHSELDNVNIAGVSTFAGAIDANGDLDVDGHTNLDNVSIVGVTTFNGLSTNDVIRVRSADSNGNCVVNILSEGTTGNSRILFSDTAATSGDGWISYSHNDRALTFTTAGTSNERLRIDSNGRILYGFTSNFTGAKLQLNLGAGGSAINIFTASNDANGSILDLYKTRGTAPNNYTALQDGDFIGELRFRGTTGSSYVNGAVIQAKVNGTTGSGNDLPTDLIFRLQPDGSGNTGEVFRITGSGKVLVGDGNSVSPSRHLDVRGSGQQQILIGSTNNQGASIIFDGHGGGDGSGGNYAGVEMGADGHFDIRNYDPNKNIIFGVGSNVGGNDSVTITSAGRVLIGTSDEGHGNADDLTVATAGGSLGHTGITIRSGTSSDGNIFFSDATSGGGETIGGIKYKHGGAGSNPETLNFIANGLTRATVGATYLYVDDGTNGRITLQPESTNVNQILSTTTAFGSYCNLKYQAADHIFLYGGSERFRIHNSGAIGLSGANYGSSGQVLTSQGSGSAVTWSTVSTQDTLSFRNMIINGAAMISQRLGNSTYNLSSAASYYPVDRFRCWAVGGGTLLIQRSDDAPSGFQKFNHVYSEYY